MSTIADVLLDKIGFFGLWFICGTTTFISKIDYRPPTVLVIDSVSAFLLTATIQKTKYGKGIDHFVQENEISKTESIDKLVTKF